MNENKTLADRIDAAREIMILNFNYVIHQNHCIANVK